MAHELLVEGIGLDRGGHGHVGQQQRREADVGLCVKAVLGEPFLQAGFGEVALASVGEEGCLGCALEGSWGEGEEVGC